jgi:hypothetical protein
MRLHRRSNRMQSILFKMAREERSGQGLYNSPMASKESREMTTTRQATEHAWIEFHKGIHPEVRPIMTGVFLYAFKAGIRHHKELVTGQMKSMIKKYEDDTE